MRFRKLRIAWSVACVVACILLVALWVRSYWKVDYVEQRSAAISLNGGSVRGIIGFSIWHTPPLETPRWKYESHEPDYDEHLPKGGFLLGIRGGAFSVFV